MNVIRLMGFDVDPNSPPIDHKKIGRFHKVERDSLIQLANLGDHENIRNVMGEIGDELIGAFFFQNIGQNDQLDTVVSIVLKTDEQDPNKSFLGVVAFEPPDDDAIRIFAPMVELNEYHYTMDGLTRPTFNNHAVCKYDDLQKHLDKVGLILIHETSWRKVRVYESFFYPSTKRVAVLIHEVVDIDPRSQQYLLKNTGKVLFHLYDEPAKPAQKESAPNDQPKTYTPAEESINYLLAQAHKKMVKLPVQHYRERQEFTDHIHALQNIIMSRVMQRIEGVRPRLERPDWDGGNPS